MNYLRVILWDCMKEIILFKYYHIKKLYVFELTDKWHGMYWHLECYSWYWKLILQFELKFNFIFLCEDDLKPCDKMYLKFKNYLFYWFKSYGLWKMKATCSENEVNLQLFWWLHFLMIIYYELIIICTLCQIIYEKCIILYLWIK